MKFRKNCSAGSKVDMEGDSDGMSISYPYASSFWDKKVKSPIDMPMKT